MRIKLGLTCALASLVLVSPVRGDDILATVFQFTPPGPTDPAPDLTGVIKIDSVSGVASPFIPENLAQGFGYLSDIAIGPHDGLIYVSSQVGTITRFQPDGSPLGLYAFFGLPEAPEGVNTLEFNSDGTLYAATVAGTIAKIDPTGTRQADVATGLEFPTGLAIASNGDLYAAVGQVGGDGSVLRIAPGSAPETVLPPGTIGGGSGLTFDAAPGDYNGDLQNNGDDYTTWSDAYASAGTVADGNGDGVVDAADYTIWRDNEGAHARLLIPDFAQDASGNEIVAFDLITNTPSTLATIDVEIPDPLPPGGVATNVPSEVLLTPSGTLLVSTLGPTQRPDNNASLLEYAADGTFLRTIQTNLPPLSGIALLPSIAVTGATIPEPQAMALAAFALMTLARRRD